jgi:CRP/FNR family cyclic AMP-dependent transcriptional regulator
MPPSASDLRTIPLFQGFTAGELEGISALFIAHTLDPSKPLFDVGDPAEYFWLLTSGSVRLDRPGDDVFELRPPALIGELGALTNLVRSTRATAAPGSTVWRLHTLSVQQFFADHQEQGLRFLVNLLGVVADKVLRDQNRIADMRQHVVTTQKELKRLRELVLESPETPVSAPVHDGLDGLITKNRRVNYRVTPPESLAAHLRLDNGIAPVTDISRTHVTVTVPGTPQAVGTWLSGVLHLAGAELLLSGKVYRVEGAKMTIELDLLIEEFAAVLEGYLTRVQLLDILC